MEKVIGIDLGTTNSCVAIVENGVPTVIPNRGGYKTTPSMVAITEAGKRLVGHIAKRQAITNAENTVYAAKRLIGRKWNSPQVKNAVATSSYRIVAGPAQRRAHRAARQGVQRLRGQRDGAPGDEAHRRGLPRRAGRPRPSSPSRRTSTTTSGRRPRTPARSPGSTSSASSTSRRPRRSRTASARTSRRRSPSTTSAEARSTSRSSRSASSGVFKVIATAGDTFLGGEDVDARIIDWLVQGFKERARHRPAPGSHGAAAPEGRRREGQVRAVERAGDRGQPPLHHLERPQRGAPPAAHASTGRRSRSSRRTSSSARSTSAGRRSSDARLEKDDIEEVILVGGMTRMPKIQQAVARVLRARAVQGRAPRRESSRSAPGIQGAALVDDKHEMVLLDVTPHALGIMTPGRLLRGAHPAEHDRPHAPDQDLHDEPRQPDGREDRRHAGRERARRGERAARRVHPHRPAPRAEGQRRDRGDLRDQRRRHRQRPRQGPRDRRRSSRSRSPRRAA